MGTVRPCLSFHVKQSKPQKFMIWTMQTCFCLVLVVSVRLVLSAVLPVPLIFYFLMLQRSSLWKLIELNCPFEVWSLRLYDSCESFRPRALGLFLLKQLCRGALSLLSLFG